MREIKFQAWDERTYFKDTPCMRNMDYIYSYLVQEGKFNEEDKDVLVDSGRLTFLQFTGLVDTNDKDIYEGDIIKTVGYIGIVAYEPQAAQYQIKWKDNANRYMPFNVTFSDGDTWKCDYMEIIGNIYENPELL
jgi:uncharacterized phage protein (TIGR01671 family)